MITAVAKRDDRQERDERDQYRSDIDVTGEQGRADDGLVIGFFVFIVAVFASLAALSLAAIALFFWVLRHMQVL